MKKLVPDSEELDPYKGCIVVVTGSRNLTYAEYLYDVLDIVNPKYVIQGGALGADYCAAKWAREEEKVCITVHAEWSRHGRRAGPLRNIKMLDFALSLKETVIVLGFPLDRSVGTWDCMKSAKERGIPVFWFESHE